MAKQSVICPYCSEPARLVTGKEVYPHRSDLWSKRFWECKPCDARVGCHGNSNQPLGRLANAELRRAKMAAHAAFDPLWRRKRKGRMQRGQAYSWLSEALGIPKGECHIGMFDVEMCQRVVEVCRRSTQPSRG